jgi:glycosyltransferase involved in cell wall biosynthesis
MKNVRFVMAGSGDMMNKMVKRAAELKITDHFHFTGFLKGDDVFNMFRMSDVFVMPSVSEPFGIVPLEAMQTNVPVIISNQSGVSEILRFAVKTDYWDTHAMADAIYGLLNYPSMWRMFMKYGKQEVDNLQWKNSAKNVRDVYYQALKIPLKD